MRLGRPLCAGSLCLVLAVLAQPADADILVLRDGHRLETDGPWEVRGGQVVFRTPHGVLSSLRLDEVDLEASRRATEAPPRSPPEEAEAEQTPPPVPRPKAKIVITDSNLARRRSAGGFVEGLRLPLLLDVWEASEEGETSRAAEWDESEVYRVRVLIDSYGPPAAERVAACVAERESYREGWGETGEIGPARLIAGGEGYAFFESSGPRIRVQILTRTGSDVDLGTTHPGSGSVPESSEICAMGAGSLGNGSGSSLTALHLRDGPASDIVLRRYESRFSTAARREMAGRTGYPIERSDPFGEIIWVNEAGIFPALLVASPAADLFAGF